MCFCLPLIHALQQHIISFKDKQDGSRGQLILRMDFVMGRGGSERTRGRMEHQTHCTNTCGNVHMRVHTRFLPKLVLLSAVVQAPRLSINQTCCKTPCSAESFSIKFDEHWSYYFRREVAVVLHTNHFFVAMLMSHEAYTVNDAVAKRSQKDAIKKGW